MRDRGIYIKGSLTQFYQGLSSGSGEHQWDSAGKVDAFVDVDASKLGFWQGFGIHAHVELNYGQALTSNGGAVLPVNTASTLPSSDSTLADMSLYVSQQFGDSVTVLFGKINTIDLYATGREFSGGRGVELFQHLMLSAPVTGVTPPMLLGGIASIKTDAAKFTLMVYDPQNQTRQTGFEHPFDTGVGINGSMQIDSNFFGRPGKHFFSAAYSTEDKTNLSDPYLLLPTTPPPAKKNGTPFISYAFEQTLWRDATDPKQAVGLFGQFGLSDGDANPFAWSAMVGISGASPIPGRTQDKFGIGAFHVGYSNGVKEALGLLGLPARDESGIEIFYKYLPVPWLRLSADAQFITPPSSGAQTAIITGLRAQIIF